jgi:hypothetical protein
MSIAIATCLTLLQSIVNHYIEQLLILAHRIHYIIVYLS